MNLSSASIEFKKIIIWIGVGLVILFGLWLFWLILVFLFKLVFPPPPAGPDTAFGKLPQPFVYSSKLNFKTINFNLDTPGGRITSFSKIIKVYPIPQPEGKFDSLDKAKEKAGGAGLDSEPIRISDNDWRWTSTQNPNKTLKLNIVTNNFTYTYDWIADTSALGGVFKTTDSDSIAQARNYLSDFSGLKKDLNTGSAKVSYFKLIGGERDQVGSYSEANAVQIQLFRAKIVDGQIKYSLVEPKQNLVSVMFSATARTEKRLLEINYTFWSVNFKSPATYPSKTGQEAFSDLKQGKALVVEGDGENFENINIGSISFAYYNPGEYEAYLQPVYVFKGDGLVGGVKKNFIAYVSAISSTYQR